MVDDWRRWRMWESDDEVTIEMPYSGPRLAVFSWGRVVQIRVSNVSWYIVYALIIKGS